MKRKKWNDNWKFWADKEAFALLWVVPANARDISLPHDAMIENQAYAQSANGGNTGFRDGDCYTYVKRFFAPEEWKSQIVQVLFEGVYMNAMVYLNGQLAGKNPNGYTGFLVELSDYLRYDEENELRVLVRSGAMTNSRWYSGSGIYRDVYLLTSPRCHIPAQGVKILTEQAEEELAVVKIAIEIENRKPYAGHFVLESKLLKPDGSSLSWLKSPVWLPAGEKRILVQRFCIEHPELWGEANPKLYTAALRLVAEKESACITGEPEVLDTHQERFGIRTLSLDAQRGLRVNGKSVKLRGACIHHDSGILGAATYEDAQYRQIRLLKEAGFNAVRMAHHPMAEAMLRACDELGMYVMDELCDMWDRTKSNYDYGLYFREWWRSDARSMVEKDYNHPSVVLYSIGNEIPEFGTEAGSKTAHEISTFLRELDGSRYTTAGINGIYAAGNQVTAIMKDIAAAIPGYDMEKGNVNDFLMMSKDHMDDIVVHPLLSRQLDRVCAALDIAGYNYMTARYAYDQEHNPDRIIVGSETYPPEIARNWQEVEKRSQVIGDFTWTGWDYIGEAGIGIPAYAFGEGGFHAQFPAQLAYCGDIDLTGWRRPMSYFREIVFGLRKDPYIAVQNPAHFGREALSTPWVMSDAVHSWTWPGMENMPVVVEVYADCDEVELLLNGSSLGRQCSGKEAGFRTLFETRYQPGDLTAIAWQEGIEIGRQKLSSTGHASQLVLKQEADLNTDLEQNLIYICVELQDAQGNLVFCEDQEIHLTVPEGTRAAFGSADPRPLHNYNERTTKTWYGRAQIILITDSRKLAGEVSVCTDSGLKGQLLVKQNEKDANDAKN